MNISLLLSFSPPHKTPLQVISASGETFPFKVLPDQGCFVVRNDLNQGIASVEGHISHKLQPLILMRGATPPITTQSQGASMPLSQTERIRISPAPRQSVHPATRNQAPLPGTSLRRNKNKTPVKESITPEEKNKKIDHGKPSPISRPIATIQLDAPLQSNNTKNKPGGSGSGGRRGDFSGGVALQAARQNNFRLVLIALLAQRPSTMRAIKSALGDIPTWEPKFRPPTGKGDVEQTLKNVAAYKAPGMYVLKEGLDKEIEHLRVSQSPQPESSTGAAGGAAAKHISKKRIRAAASDSEEGGPSPDARCRSTPSAPSTDEGTGNGTGSHKRAPSRPLSASSRGSGGADEIWVLEHAERLPDPAPVINSIEEYRTADAEFRRRHEMYFKLHQLLASNRKDFEALQAAVDDAPSIEEQSRIEEEIRRLWERRAGRARRWEAAFKVLQKELETWKSALQEYSAKRISPSPVPGSKPDAASIGSGREEDASNGEDLEEI